MPVFSRYRVLYLPTEESGKPRYLTISARLSDDNTFFEVRILSSHVLTSYLDFEATNPDAEYSRHDSEASANAEADEEYGRRIKDGWLPDSVAPLP